MPHEVPPRWQARLRQHIRDTTGEERDHLLATDFSPRRTVRLAFPDGSFALFRYAFHLEDRQLGEVAVFTEHCGYHFLHLDELGIEVLQTVWEHDGRED